MNYIANNTFKVFFIQYVNYKIILFRVIENNKKVIFKHGHIRPLIIVNWGLQLIKNLFDYRLLSVTSKKLSFELITFMILITLL